MALDDLVRTRTWAQLEDRVWRLAEVLSARLGVAPGDHVAMIVGNRVEFVELVLASVVSGVRVTPVNWHLAADEMAYVVDDCAARVVFVDPGLDAALGHAWGDRCLVTLGVELEDLVASASGHPADLGGPAGGTMPYTSGTTGRPKGVERALAPSAAEQLVALVRAGSRVGLEGRGPHLVTGPMYHAAPGGFAVMGLLAGAPLVIMPRWDTTAFGDLIGRYMVATTHMVPTMFTRLCALDPDERSRLDPSSLRMVLHGAAPISGDLKERMIRWWGPVFVEYWGASEGGAVTLVDSAQWSAHPGTVGRALEGYRVEAYDEDGRVMSRGETGLLGAHHGGTDRVFRYHGDPAKTDAAYLPDGAYSLGDIGYVDSDGFVYLSDRADNTIISGGVNIYPAEIEAVLSAHPAVRDVAVFGVPDDEWGESVMAAVELVDVGAASPALEAELASFARGHLAGYKVPRRWRFEASLPRNEAGKVLTRLLREPHWQGRARSI